ncbi:MAG TPA: DUF3122 domain-containing protein [Oscillatoriales cyanobacterium M59_W2019_021]|nr:MAG: DUF3122 domain-containing protein [Cyanobacteria bacterium J055]HIK32792.1 DUF3122 domain-containing protein [Oscillatoriales cyanobacterium M4454_W2019_049]HIK51494.1 DUF3122 domain-containing protein [Oscillatoriales cyanobacterium M59_W2019_021]
MKDRIRRILSLILLAVTIAILMCVGVGTFNLPSAAAAIQVLEESPDRILYQSRHKFQDNRGNAWQVVFFKRVEADESPSLNLRLVAFPGTADFAHPQPLKIKTKTGKQFEAEDLFAEAAPTANVGQYNLENILDRLPSFASIDLVTTMKDDRTVALKIPSEVILEWQTIAGY